MARACSRCHPGLTSVVTQGRSILEPSERADAGAARFAGVVAARCWQEPTARHDPLPNTWGARGCADSCYVVTSCHPTPLPRLGEGVRLRSLPR